MQTDEEVRTRLRELLSDDLDRLVPSATLLADVRRRHRRRRQLQLVAAPLLAACCALALVAFLAARSPASPSPTRQSNDVASLGPSPSATTPADPPGPTVQLLGYAFELPSGFVVRHRSKVVNLSTIQPAQPVGGRDQFMTASTPQRARTLDIVVYRGPIAAAEAEVEPPSPDAVERTRIAGHPATITPYGGDDSGLLETRVRVAPSELIWVDSEGVSRVAVVTMLRDALRGS